MFYLETERLRIEHLTLDDAGFILRLLNDPAFLENIGDKGVRNLEDARSYLRDGPMASYKKNGFGLFRVSNKHSGAVMGICGLISREALDDVDIGYALLPEFCGQGYAVESARAVLDFGKEQLHLDPIVAVVSPGNTASVRLLEKLGMEFTRKIRLDSGQPEIDLFA